MFIRNCWYMVAWDHEIPPDGLFSHTVIGEPLLTAFEEDRRMITAQARNIAGNPGAPMLPLAMDSALTQFRRIVERALQAERGSTVAA